MTSFPSRRFKEHASKKEVCVGESYWALSELEFMDACQREFARNILRKHKKDSPECAKAWKEFQQEEKDRRKKEKEGFDYRDCRAAVAAYKRIALERHTRWYDAWIKAQRGDGPEPKAFRETEEYLTILQTERANREKEEEYMKEVMLARDRDPEFGQLLPKHPVTDAIKKKFWWAKNKPNILVENIVTNLSTDNIVDRITDRTSQRSDKGKSPNRSPEESSSESDSDNGKSSSRRSNSKRSRDHHGLDKKRSKDSMKRRHGK